MYGCHKEKLGISRKKCAALKAKKLFAQIILFFLYRGMRVLYRLDSRVKEEVDGWPLGRTVVLRASQEGPVLCMKRVSWGLARVRPVAHPEIEIAFKSLDGAFLVFSGQIGTAGAYAQHRFAVKGEVSAVMSVVRCMDLTEAYLFPKVITRRILRRVPVKQTSSINVYCRAILGL